MKGLKRKSFAGAVLAAVMAFTAAAVPIMQTGVSAATVPIWSEDFESYSLESSVGTNGIVKQDPDEETQENKTVFVLEGGSFSKEFEGGLTGTVEMNARIKSANKSNCLVRISGDNDATIALIRVGCLTKGTSINGFSMNGEWDTSTRRWAALTQESGAPQSNTLTNDISTVYYIGWGGDNSWQNIKIIADMETKTYDVYIADKEITQEMIDNQEINSYCEGIPFYDMNASKATAVSIEPQWIYLTSDVKYNVYFDDISVNQITEDMPSAAVDAEPIGEVFEDGSMGWTAETSFDGVPTSAVWTITNVEGKTATIDAKIPTVENAAVKVGLVLTDDAIGANTINGVTFELK